MLFKESNEYEYVLFKNGKRNICKIFLSCSYRFFFDEFVNFIVDISFGDFVEFFG